MKERLWTKDFIFIMLINFLVFSNHFMIVPSFPFYIESRGGSEAIAGMIATLFSFIAVISRPVFGWLLDRGNRKTLLLLGIFLMGLTTLSYMAAVSLTVLFLLRMINGMGLSCATTSSTTFTSDVVPGKRFAEGMGMFGMAVTLATALAPSAGIALMQKSGFSTLFSTSAGCMAAALILFVFLRSKKIPVNRMPFQIRTMFESNALPASTVILLFMMTFGAIENFIAKFAVSAGLPGGSYFIFMSVAIIFTRIFLSRVADKRGEALFVYMGNLSMFAALIILACNVNMLTFIISALLSGFGFGGLEPALLSMAISTVAPERRGAANSTFFCAYDIGIGFGGGMAGYLISYSGYGSMFISMALANAVSILIYLFWAKNHSSAFRNMHGNKN